ncbi:T9SS type A sorting domain-containing protein [Saprospira sp. CCB-QB6]|uniref:T9SS type A sorting domain-containing protein n=1 Tax=Saprospira sp. CCB-QB6 TaxID=3023936 RepID=UPI00234A2998|nr:T9SS type A sorting domain-containing protein [Saprospira sp. CCB-QB6]WCL81813.1 T9SS type A sorting domain-containing protein [Saprospira sp. CCB-QB6]
MLHKLLQTVFTFGLLLWASASWAQNCSLPATGYLFAVNDANGNCIHREPLTDPYQSPSGSMATPDYQFNYCTSGGTNLSLAAGGSWSNITWGLETSSPDLSLNTTGAGGISNTHPLSGGTVGTNYPVLEIDAAYAGTTIMLRLEYTGAADSNNDNGGIYYIQINLTDPIADVTLDPTELSICNGESTDIDASASNCVSCPTYSYEWFDGASSIGTAGANLVVSPTSSTTYTLVTTTDNYCVHSQPVPVTVQDVPVLNPISAADICAGGVTSVTTSPSLCLSGTCPNGIIWSWSVTHGATSDPDESGGGQTTPVFNDLHTAAGTETVTLTGNLNGCIASVSSGFTIFAKPSYTATTNSTSICLGETINLGANISGSIASPYTATWTSSDPVNAAVGTPSVSSVTTSSTPSAPSGSYDYTLSIKDNNQCTGATVAVSVEVKDSFVFAAGPYNVTSVSTVGPVIGGDNTTEIQIDDLIQPTDNRCDGNFTDHRGQGGEYQNNKDYTRTICPGTPGAMLQVVFTSFELETSYYTPTEDYLQVYDGTNTSATMIDEYYGYNGSPYGLYGSSNYGSNVPGTITATNPTGCLTFKFHSNGSYHYDGWTADIKCIITPYVDNISYDNSAMVSNICQGDYTVLALSESDPDFDFPSNAADIDWQFVSGPAAAPAALYFNDNKEVYVGPFTTAGTYVYRVDVDAAGTDCPSVHWFEVQVDPQPTVTLSTTNGTGPFCSSEAVVLSGSTSGGSFSRWEKNGVTIAGATNPTTLSDMHSNVGGSSTETVTYSYIAGSGQCEAVATIDIEFYPETVADIPHSGRTYCVTGNPIPVQASPDPSQGGSYAYSWSASPVLAHSISSNGSEYTFDNPLDGETSTLTLTVTDVNSCTATDTELFEFEDCGTFVLNTTPVSGDVCMGDNIILEVVDNQDAAAIADGSLRITYDWFDGTRTLSTTPGGNQLTYLTSPSMPTNLDVTVTLEQYVCFLGSGTNPSTCLFGAYQLVLSDNLPATVNVIDPSPVLEPDTAVGPYCYGDTLDVEASCSSCPYPLTYSWPSHLSFSGEGPHRIDLLQDTMVIVAGHYNGCEGRDTVYYQVRPSLEPTIVQGNSIASCLGDFVSLDATTVACSNCSYSWNTGQSGTNISVSQDGDYIFSVEQYDCVEHDTITLVNYNQVQPIVETADSVAITGIYLPLCDGAPVTLHVDPTSCPSCSFAWSNGSTSPNFTVNTSGGYYVNVIDSNGCRGSSAPILAVPSLEGQGAIATASPNPMCNDSIVELTATACASCSYVWYDSNNDTVGLGRTITLTGGSAADTYYAILTNEDGCEYATNLVDVTYTVLNAPQILATADSICVPNGTSTLNVVVEPDYIGYQWYKGSTMQSGYVGSSFTATSTGAYWVEVLHSSGCVLSSDTIVIDTAGFAPTAATLAGNTTETVCPGDSVTITTATEVGWTYQWYRNGIAVSGAIGSAYSASQAGNYYVEVNAPGCFAITNQVVIQKAAVDSVNASTDKLAICPGDEATLSVTLCIGCEYQWVNATNGLDLTTLSNTNSSYTTNVGGSFYARVESNNNGCFVNSDTINIASLALVTPAININSSSPYVCDGQSSTLTTSQCSSCTYTWMRNNVPVFGALNDTFFIVSDPSDAGTYSVAVTYANGCQDTSIVESILDGSYDLAIEIDPNSPDSIVCNNSPVDLQIDSVTSGSLYCNLGCTFQWFRGGSPLVPSNANAYTTTEGGFFKLRMTDSRGCIEESNTVTVREVDLNPFVTSNATAICGPGGTVELSYTDSSNCVGCSYQWLKGGSAAPLYGLNTSNTTPFYETDSVGVYSLEVTQLGCAALSNQVALNRLNGLSIPVSSTKANICDGDTLTIYRMGGGCAGCQFQWLLNDQPILSATTPNFLVNNIPGNYTLEMVDAATGCTDTSATISLSNVAAPTGFDLTLSAAGISPLTPTGAAVSLYDAVQPSSIRQSLNDSFYSQPFDASLNANSGLFGIGNESFDPSISGAGYHQVYYRYDTLGCNFIADDIMLVFEDPSVDIFNENPVAPSLEACVADTLQLQVNNMPFYVDSIYLRDVTNNYVLVPIETNGLQAQTYGSDIVYTGVIRLGIPAWAQESFMMMTSAANADTFFTSFVLVHNENLEISGLPGVICSNGDSIELTGTPTGGFFTAEYTGASGGSTIAANTLIPGAFSGSTFYPTAATYGSYGSDQVQNVKVIYNYVNTYTNGSTCPLTDTDTAWVDARGVFLDSIQFNPISISQDRELLKNLVYRVYPYSAQPSQWEAVGTIGFSGSFTFPAGAPIDFLPPNAGLGTHAMTYVINNGGCENSVEDSIEVIEAPQSIGIRDSICRTETFANFGRETGLYSYFDGPNIPIQAGVSFSDTINIMVVGNTAAAGLTTVNSATNLEEYNYDPTAVPGNYDTLSLEYVYRKVEYVFGTPVDTVEYVVGSIVTPIFIEDTFQVEIIDSIVNDIYCEENELFLLGGAPSGGIFTLSGGTAAYAAGDTLVNNILNPFDVHSPESSNTTYDLTYIKQGAVCQNSDTKQITIPEPLDPSFLPASMSTIYCASDPIDPINISTQGSNFTSLWLVNGVAQGGLFFNPGPLVPGNQVVTHIVTDTIFGCSYEAIDTFVVNALPQLSVTPLLQSSYCTNDSIVTLEVSPNPVCAQFVSGGQDILFANFDSLAFPPGGWLALNNSASGNPWVRTTIAPYSGVGAAYVNSSNDVEDAWLFTPTLNLVTGHTYRISFFAKADNCTPPPCDPAQINVYMGQGQSISAQQAGIQIGDTAIHQTFYNPYSFDYLHTGVTGSFNFAFQNASGIDAQGITLDDVKVEDLSQTGCIAGGSGSMIGPGISYVVDSTYTFNPQLVTPGAYNVRYVYTDASTGCTDSIQMPIKVKPHPIVSFTNLDSLYCSNAAAIALNPSPQGGTFTSTGPNLDLAALAYDPVAAHNNEVVSYSYTDLSTLCTSIIRDTATVMAIPDSATFNGVDTSYCVYEDSIFLDFVPVFGAPLPGYFVGAGVYPDSAGAGVSVFYPDSAVIQSGRYGEFELRYIYPTNSICVDTAKIITRVDARPDLNFTNMPDSICLNAGAVQIRVNNHVITGAQGQIEYDTLVGIGPVFGGNFLPSLGLQDTLVARNFGVGWHHIDYSYTDRNGCSSSISDSFRVDTIPELYFTGLNADRVYCENETPSLLLAYQPYYPGSGYLEITSGPDTFNLDSSFYLIEPIRLVDTNSTTRLYDVYYTYTDLNGCTNELTDSFEVRPYPRIFMNISQSFCSADTIENLMPYVTPQGGIFTDDLVVTDIRQDSFLALNGNSGPRNITYYYYDTLTTCSNSDQQVVTLYNTPEVDFYALGGCVAANITFVEDTLASNLVAGVDSIWQIEWIYGDGNSSVVVPASGVSIPNQVHTYNTDGNYQVQLVVNNQNQCIDTMSNQLIVSPYVNTIHQTPYVEDFQVDAGGWYQEEADVLLPDSLALWQRAELVAPAINDPGNFAWVTAAQAPYTYGAGEHAWVYSPCFDFTQSWRPMIVLNTWRHTLNDIDGAIMEYYDNATNEWLRLGDPQVGINWYQTDFLLSRPGNQAGLSSPKGWTDSSSTWDNSRYRLDHLTGEDFVRFRIAFASDASTITTDGFEGFAFDSVWVGERNRNLLLEHFSNYYHVNTQGDSMDAINAYVYNDLVYNNNNGRDLNLIQYATDINSQDPLNVLNWEDNSARISYYGVSDNSSYRLNGTIRGVNFTEELDQWNIDYDMMQFADFNLQLDPIVFSGNTLQIDAEGEALKQLDSSDYSFHVVITEDRVSNYRGFPEMAVMRTILPDAAGVQYAQPWAVGEQFSYSGSWVYNLGSLDSNNLQAVAFIQDNATKQVLQVATTRDLTIYPPTGVLNEESIQSIGEELNGITLYPNPATEAFQVAFTKGLSEDCQWQLVDVLGRVLQDGTAQAGSLSIQVQTPNLSEGTYFFILKNGQAMAQRQVVIVRP